MRVWLVPLTALCLLFASRTAALDDTTPKLRWGIAGGLSGTLPLGDVRASDARRDEFTKALWVDLEPLQFDLGDHFNLSPIARFVWLGGMEPKALEAALDPARRTNAAGKRFAEPKVSALELGLKLRYFPWGDGRVRPYGAVGLGYTTVGAGYETAAATSTGGPGGPSSSELHVHRHQGLAARLGLGVRYDQPIRAFNTDMRVPIALELFYTHNTWLSLSRDESLEITPRQLAGSSLFLDYLGVSLTVGFLR